MDLCRRPLFLARRDATKRETTKQDARKNASKPTHQKTKHLNHTFEHAVSAVKVEMHLVATSARCVAADQRFQMLARRCRGFSDLSYSLDVGPIKPSLNRRGMHSIARGQSGDGIQATMRESNQSRIPRGRILSPARRTSVPSHRKC
jgi:hypothetical protein